MTKWVLNLVIKCAFESTSQDEPWICCSGEGVDALMYNQLDF